MAALFRAGLWQLLPLHVLVRDYHVQLSDAALPAVIRLRILLGGIRNALSGVSGPASLQSPAPRRIRNGSLIRSQRHGPYAAYLPSTGSRGGRTDQTSRPPHARDDVPERRRARRA